MTPTRNTFGYQHNGAVYKSPSFQLKELLRLQNNKESYKRIESIILDAGERHFDVEMTGKAQETAIIAIKEELKEQIPSVFAEEESEKRLYFALQVALQAHRIARRVKKETQGGSQRLNCEKNCETLLEPMGSPNPPLPKTNNQTYSSGSIPLASSSTIIPSQSLIIHNDGDSDISSSLAPIAQFLQSCVPSMDHLLQSFIDFGCVTEEFLLAISLWTPEMIDEFLQKLPPSKAGKVVTEMEKLTLRFHFQTYFSK